MFKRRMLLAALAAGTLGGGVVGAAPALAGSAMRSTSGRSSVNKTSTTFGGWKVDVAKTTASVTTEFVVPQVNCAGAKQEESAAPGAYMAKKTGHGSGEFFGGVVEFLCINQHYVALSAAELGNKVDFGGTAKPGDLVKTTVVDGKQTATLTVQDLTKGHTFTLKKSTAAQTPAWVMAGLYQQYSLGKPSKPYSLPDFGTLHLRAVQVNGKPLGSQNGLPYNWVTSKTEAPRVRTGALTGGSSHTSRNAFTVTWKHS